MGFPRNGCSPKGSGRCDPVASNATEAGRARNRRVEIIVQSSVVKQTLDNAGLDTTPAVPSPSKRSGVHTKVAAKVAPTLADIGPHLGPN